MKNNKWKKIAFVCMGISIICAGCSTHSENTQENEISTLMQESESNLEDKDNLTENKKEYEGEKDMENRALTDEQIELLCGMTIDEDSVLKGQLSDWQTEVLNQYDYAMEYLAKKYPSYTFHMVSCENKNKLNAYTTFTFEDVKNPKEYYSLYLYVDGEGDQSTYEAKDNFYGKLYEEEFSEKMLALVQKKFPECTDAEVILPYVEGEEFGENIDLDEVFRGQLKMNQDTRLIFEEDQMSDQEYRTKCQELETCIKESGLEGSFSVHLVDRNDPEQVLYEDNFFGE